jgi:hypothetical protein
MKAMVQARLDEETLAALERLRREGLTTSEVIRKGIHLAAKEHPARPRLKVIGLGNYDSGIPDLASNKKHLANFGRKSMGRGWRRPQQSSAK